MSRGRLLAALAIAAGLTPLNSTMVAVALPMLSAEFSVAASGVTAWVVTGYLVATILCQMPAGSVADRVGYARALTVGRWTFAGGTVAALLAPALGLVVLGRLLMAAGGALMIPTAMALLRVSVPPERRARAFGAMGAVMAGSAAVGPAMGGLVAARFGWRALFLVNLPLLALSWALQPRGLAEAHPPARTGGAEPWVTRVLATPGFAAGGAVIALQNLAMYALMFQIPFLFGVLGGASGPEVGFTIMILAATMATSAPVGGWAAERLGVKAVVVGGGLVGALGMASLTWVGTAFSIVDVGVRLVLVGVGLGVSTGPSQAAALSVVDPRHSGRASAMISMLRYIGGVAGTTILSVSLGGSADSLARHHAALWIFTAALAGSALCAAGLRSLSGRHS